MKEIKTDVCIIGIGAGGFGCLHRLSEYNIKTVAVEKNAAFGGTAVFSGVNCWEPGVSLDGVHLLIKDALEKIPDGCMVAKTVPNCRLIDKTDEQSFEKYPWGLSVRADEDYYSTLKRCMHYNGADALKYRRFQFEGEAMAAVMKRLTDKNCVKSMLGYTLTDVEKKDGIIISVTVKNGNHAVKIFADYFVDSTGDICLARMADCKTTLGAEASAIYDEPSAPDTPQMSINGVSYVFRVRKTNNPQHIDMIDERLIRDDIKTVSCFNMYPNGDINVNMLPTMSGEEYFRLGAKADNTGKNTMLSYWNYLQREKGMRGYTTVKRYSAGVRESYRLIGRYVLCENDVDSGISDKKIIAVADHAKDVHKESSSCREILMPYGIPADCTRAVEYDNLFVACRGASFSHIAASSARLTRTMLSLGEGAAEYIRELKENGKFTNSVQGRLVEKFKKTLYSV